MAGFSAGGANSRDVREFSTTTDGIPLTAAGALPPTAWTDEAAAGERTISAGTPRALFGVDVVEPISPYPNDYAVSSDGERFLVNSVAQEVDRQTLTVLLNWTAALKN